VAIRKWVRFVLTFYLTAPLLGCYLAVAVTIATAWDEKNVFLAIASIIAFVIATAIFVVAIWALRQLTRKGPS
jgi:FtsH-binding integral membrane protein